MPDNFQGTVLLGTWAKIPVSKVGCHLMVRRHDHNEELFWGCSMIRFQSLCWHLRFTQCLKPKISICARALASLKNWRGKPCKSSQGAWQPQVLLRAMHTLSFFFQGEERHVLPPGVFQTLGLLSPRRLIPMCCVGIAHASSIIAFLGN